ncbi:MAG: efflux RND transporter periplasmic adaptor subunit [Deltaproteobacteria bacterium]
MSESTPGPVRRIHALPAILAAILMVVALIFRHDLVAWFTGAPLDGGPTSSATRVRAGALSIEVAMQPDPPREKGNRARVKVTTSAGAPVTGATVRLDYVMPAMGGMQEMRGGGDGTDDGGGRYSIPFDLPMSGSWTVELRVGSSAGTASARYTLRVGSSGLTPLAGTGEASAGSGSATGSGSDAAYYTCSMHPHVHAEHPGVCPICSMPLLPVSQTEQQTAVVRVDENRRARLGIRTAKVVRAPMTLEIRAPGRLVVDETRLHDVTLEIGGYVSALAVNATGQRVAKGDPLFTLYSPELYAAQQEYLIARTNRDAMHEAGDATRSDALVRAAETKLELWGLGEDQLHAIVAKGEPIERVPFRSPASGVVMEKSVVDGDAVTAGQRLFRIADLDQIWVEADVYEADLGRIAKGQAATITLTYLPGRTFEGKVAFIYPYLDPTSRTGRVRIALPNKGIELKPDMFATVTFDLPLGDRIQVPSSAVIYTGPRRLVFVDLGDGRLRPQEITIGARSGDLVEVLSGINEGDSIVTSGNFLVAAESRVRSGGMLPEGDGDAH